MLKETEVMSQVKQFLKERGYPPSCDKHGVVRGWFSRDKMQCQWSIRIGGHGGEIVTFRAYCPMKVPAARRAAAAEYLMRTNWGLSFGSFEINWSNGEVMCRTSIPATESSISEKAMEHLIYASGYLVDRYMPGLLAVALGNADPQKAVEDAERNDSAPESEPVATEENAGSDAPAAPPDNTASEDENPTTTRRRRLFDNEN
jgi:hypothetical protein